MEVRFLFISFFHICRLKFEGDSVNVYRVSQFNIMNVCVLDSKDVMNVNGRALLAVVRAKVFFLKLFDFSGYIRNVGKRYEGDG